MLRCDTGIGLPSFYHFLNRSCTVDGPAQCKVTAVGSLYQNESWTLQTSVIEFFVTTRAVLAKLLQNMPTLTPDLSLRRKEGKSLSKASTVLFFRALSFLLPEYWDGQFVLRR